MRNHHDIESSSVTISEENKPLFVCSKTNKMFRHPVIASNGKTYEVAGLLIYLRHHGNIIDEETITSVEYHHDLYAAINAQEKGLLASLARYTEYDIDRFLPLLQRAITECAEAASVQEYKGQVSRSMVELLDDEFVCAFTKQVYCFPVTLLTATPTLLYKTYEALPLLNWFRKQRDNSGDQRELKDPLTQHAVISVEFNALMYQVINTITRYARANERYLLNHYPTGSVDSVLKELTELIKPKLEESRTTSPTTIPASSRRVHGERVVTPNTLVDVHAQPVGPLMQNQDAFVPNIQRQTFITIFLALSVIDFFFCKNLVNWIDDRMMNEESDQCFIDRHSAVQGNIALSLGCSVALFLSYLCVYGCIGTLGVIRDNIADYGRHALNNLGLFGHGFNANNGNNQIAVQEQPPQLR